MLLNVNILVIIFSVAFIIHKILVYEIYNKIVIMYYLLYLEKLKNLYYYILEFKRFHLNNQFNNL